jgi:hypothetical protein
VLPAAIFAGCGIASVRTMVCRLGSVRWLRPVLALVLAAAGLATVLGLITTPATTLQEGRTFASSQINVADMKAALVMKAHWAGGRALVQDYGDEVATFYSAIPLQDVIYEGTNKDDLWRAALRDPSTVDVRMIYMRSTPGNQDQVWQALHNSPVLRKYHLIYKDADQLVYAWNNPRLTTRTELKIERRGSAHRHPGAMSRPGRLLARGGATWFYGARNTCQTSVAPRGSLVLVTNRRNGAHITCRVTGTGPGSPGHIVNLTRPQFRQLGDPADGVVPVGISANTLE